MERVCMFCGKTFLYSGRYPKKYCSVVCGSRFRQKKYHDSHPERKAEERKRFNSWVERRMHQRIKSRAKRLGIPFDIDIEDIIVPEYCPVLGIKLVFTPDCGRNPIASPSVDRIIPALGYTKGNIRVISNRANLLKSNASVEELDMVLKDLIRITKV